MLALIVIPVAPSVVSIVVTVATTSAVITLIPAQPCTENVGHLHLRCTTLPLDVELGNPSESGIRLVPGRTLGGVISPRAG